MNITTYLNAIYGTKNEPNLNNIGRKEWFAKALFFHAGHVLCKDDEKPSFKSKPTSDEIKADSKNRLSITSVKTLFYKPKRFGPKMRGGFPDPIEMEDLAAFFDEEIKESATIRVMRNFGIEIDSLPSKEERKAFFDVLSIQFQYIVTDRSKSVENIVKTKYLERIQAIDNAKFISQRELDNTKEDLVNLMVLRKTLKEVLCQLKKNDLITIPIPTEFVFLIDGCAAIMSPMTFNNPELEESRAAYLRIQSDLLNLLLDKTTLKETTNFRKWIKDPDVFKPGPDVFTSGPDVLPRDLYVLEPDPEMAYFVDKGIGEFHASKNKVCGLRNSLELLVEKILQLENEMVNKLSKA